MSTYLARQADLARRDGQRRKLFTKLTKCELEDIYHILPRPGSPVTTCAAQTLVDFIEHEMRNALG